MTHALLLLALLADPPAADLRAGLAGGVAFLEGHQNKDGSFGQRTSGRSYEITAAVPGGLDAFRAATTALCWLGLNDCGAAEETQARALAWLVRHARVGRANGGQLYNTWSFAYGLQALSQALRTKAKGASAEELTAAANELVRALSIYQTPDGGWGYYDFEYGTYRPVWSTSFSTATAVVALREAESAGIEVPQRMFDRAAANLLACRRPDGSFLYGTYMKYRPNHPVNDPKGASLRIPACNLALLLGGSGGVGEKQIRWGLEQLVEQHRFALAGVRRPIPHESWYAVSGYFYLYGHAYAAMGLERVPEQERAAFARHIVSAVLETRQPDGSFWDYPLYGYHKFYGTGFALMALARCRACLPEE